MASPQKENGYTPIANEIVWALWHTNLSSYETRVIWYLFRKTYGWKKKTDKIPLSQFSKDMGMDRRLIHRAIKSLSAKNIIVIYRDDKWCIRYGFQKNYTKWKPPITVIYTDDIKQDTENKEINGLSVINTDDKVSSVQIPSKEIKSFLSDSIEIRLSNFLFNWMKKNNPKAKQPNLQTWAKTFDLMIRIDKREIEDIKFIIEWCQKDEFWKSNILSPKKLREKFDQLIIKSNRTIKQIPKKEYIDV